MSIQDRKKDHIDLTVTEQTQYSQTTGLEAYNFRHNALPEVNYEDINTEILFLDRAFSFPLFISSMTGGYAGAKAVNAVIAEFCQHRNLPFGVGSQRAMLEDEDELASFEVVRTKAPDAFIAANIGGAQLTGGISDDKLNRLTESIRADAIIIHLNPLQELMQPEGDRDFRGIREGIHDLVEKTQLPVIVKETGAGISGDVARQLLGIGVKVIDIAGAGGTSWAKVENQRERNRSPQTNFNNWGLSTAFCLEEVSVLKWEKHFQIISSGGIRNATDIAKSICLGADICAMAQPVIKTIHKSGLDGLYRWIDALEKDLKTILCLLGCENLQQLSPSHLYKS
jgi:isopentenyl-diphosphate delta-isomerase